MGGGVLVYGEPILPIRRIHSCVVLLKHQGALALKDVFILVRF